MNKISLIAALLPMTVSCIPWWTLEDDDDPPQPVVDDTPPVPEPAPDLAPHIEVQVPYWPPLGPDSALTVTVSDDSGLDFVQVSFGYDLLFFPFGLSEDIIVRADELGEGLGNLEVIAVDVHGQRQDAIVNGVLVDLTPPEITLGDVIVRHGEGSVVELWATDAWVLGHVELAVGETVSTYDFEDAYPSTLGESWHYQLVQFPSQDFAQGTHDAVVTLFDGAGNSTQTMFALTLDGEVPTVAITSPEPDAVVSGLFEVALTAADDGTGPVAIELRVNGIPVATAVGPTATVQLDAATLTPGPAELTAVATDQAGNESTVATVPITVQ